MFGINSALQNKEHVALNLETNFKTRSKRHKMDTGFLKVGIVLYYNPDLAGLFESSFSKKRKIK